MYGCVMCIRVCTCVNECEHMPVYCDFMGASGGTMVENISGFCPVCSVESVVRPLICLLKFVTVSDSVNLLVHITLFAKTSSVPNALAPNDRTRLNAYLIWYSPDTHPRTPTRIHPHPAGIHPPDAHT